MQNIKTFVSHFVAWEWISSLTKSLFKLASYIVELPMVASGIYIMIATGIPSANNAHWFNLAMGVLLASPEILAPGAFFRAETMQARGKVKVAKVTRWLAGLMLFFAALTLSSIMIFHFPDTVIQAIMFCRVMSSLGYSIITRIEMEPGAETPTTPPALTQPDYGPITAPIAQMYASVEQRLSELETRLHQQLADVQTEQGEQTRTIVELSANAEQAQHVQQMEQQRVLSRVQEIENSVPAVDQTAMINAVIEHFAEQFDDAMRRLAEQQVHVSPVDEIPALTERLNAKQRTPNSQKIVRLAPRLSDGGNYQEAVYRLLQEDETRGPRELARLAGCSPATAKNYRDLYLSTHSNHNGTAN